MARFLVDEDLPTSTPKVFENHGYPVESVRSLGMRGATDTEVMDQAYEDDRIVVTRDKDFGDVLRYPKANHPGAVIVRLPHTFTTQQINERLDAFLENVDPNIFEHSVIVLELGRYRVRDLGDGCRR